MKTNALFAVVLLAGYAFGLPLDAAARTLTRGPYLQLGTESSIVVRWRTETATNSRVRYGTNPSNLSSVVDDSTSATGHVVKLTGLTPSTKYYYSIGHSAVTLAGAANHFFVAAPAPGIEQPTHIWVLGNSVTAIAKARTVRDAYLKYKGAYKAAATAGPRSISTCQARTCGVRLTCQDPSISCTNQVNLTVPASALKLRRDPSASAKARGRVTFAAAAVNVPPGRTDIFQLRLNKNGRKIVKKKNVKRLKGRLEVRNIISGAIVTNTPITIRLITLSITSYGATGNDTTDDTTAINNTINAAKAQGGKVYVPAGTFHHNTNFTLDSVTMTGEGDASVLVATNKANSSIVLIGNSPAIKSVKLTSPNADVRDTTPWSCGVEVRAATNFTVDNVTVSRMGSAGIFTWRDSGPGKVINNRVTDTLADAIHFTGKSHDIIAADNTVRYAGDDMIAMVSYDSANIVRNVLVQDNDVAENDWGRGITSVGSSDITIQGNKIGRTGHAAGILVATEPAYTSPPLSNVLIRNNQISNNSGSTGQGAFLISGLNANINRIRFEGNTITNPVHDAITLEGDNSNTAIINNTVIDPAGPAFNLQSGTNTYCSGNTLNGGTTSHSKCTGVNNFTVTGSSLTYTRP